MLAPKLAGLTAAHGSHNAADLICLKPHEQGYTLSKKSMFEPQSC